MLATCKSHNVTSVTTNADPETAFSFFEFCHSGRRTLELIRWVKLLRVKEAQLERVSCISKESLMLSRMRCS